MGPLQHDAPDASQRDLTTGDRPRSIVHSPWHFFQAPIVTPIVYNHQQLDVLPVSEFASKAPQAMSDPKELSKRLEALNRAPLPQGAGDTAEIDELSRSRGRKSDEPIHFRRDVPRTRSRPAPRREFAGPPVSLEETVAGTQTPSSHGGRAYIIETPVPEIETNRADVCKAFRDHVSRPDSPVRSRIARSCRIKRLELEDIVFCDLETTGFMGAPLFLVGAMVWEHDTLLLRQYLARDYSEEGAAISLFLQDAAEKRLLVTFNGKSFDWPTLRVRAAATGVPFTLDPRHFDLLHVSRRIWKDRLPDCRLQTLETHICGAPREPDIPGEQIPDAYHTFVRTANAVEMVEILRHNMRDLVTLADLMTRLPEQET